VVSDGRSIYRIKIIGGGGNIGIKNSIKNYDVGGTSYNRTVCASGLKALGLRNG
jgi:hypothetical protein